MSANMMLSRRVVSPLCYYYCQNFLIDIRSLPRLNHDWNTLEEPISVMRHELINDYHFEP